MTPFQWTAAIFTVILAVYGLICVVVDIRWYFELRQIQKDIEETIQKLKEKNEDTTTTITF